MVTRRRILAATGGLAGLAATGPSGAQEKVEVQATPTLSVATKRRTGTMEIRRSGSQPSGKGPADYFTGSVRVDPLFQAPGPARVVSAHVTFEPGARTAWHTHPLGQTLIVTSGRGWVQTWGGPVEEIRPGRRGLVPAGREALAWCDADDGHDAYRHSGGARRQDRRMDGEGQRRTIPGLIAAPVVAMPRTIGRRRGKRVNGGRSPASHLDRGAATAIVIEVR